MKSKENSWQNAKYTKKEKFNFLRSLGELSLKDKILSSLHILLYLVLILGVGVMVISFYAFVIKYFWYIFFGVLFLVLLKLIINGGD